MRLVLISDTHQRHRIIDVPEGDILVHAGDITNHGSLPFVSDFNDWLGELPHPHKLVIAGNHDFSFYNPPKPAIKLITNATYLEDSGVTIDGVHFWGSPWTPLFHDWAFMKNEVGIAAQWAKIPDDTNVLITHGPSRGILDMTKQGFPVGCPHLRSRLEQLRQLRLHVFGHLHESYGIVERNGVIYANASTCDITYQPNNAPIVIDLV